MASQQVGGRRGRLSYEAQSVFVDEVFVDEDGYEGGGGDGDQGSGDATEGGAEQQGYEDGQAGQADAVLHDARREQGILHLQIDHVKNGYAEHAAPGVDCGQQQRKGYADGCAQDGDDVERTGEHAQRKGVANVQREIDDGADDAEDEHEAALAYEPLVHADAGALQGVVEAV